MGPSAISSADKASAKAINQFIVRFYDPDIKAKDARHGSLDEILTWPNSKLEFVHDYIQVLLPLPEGSMFNTRAPVIDLAVMQAFHSQSELRQQLRRSFERILKFYGFIVSTKSETELEKERDEEKVASEAAQVDTSVPKIKAPSVASVTNPPPYHIVRVPNWEKRFRNINVSVDHNHRRITRILRCLRVLGLQRECTAFFAALERVYHSPGSRISKQSMEFWRLAVTLPLHVAPDGQKCKWLEVWEKEQENSK
jgi:hypothetical protein